MGRGDNRIVPLVRCKEHGAAGNAYCYVQPDASHIPMSDCTCVGATADAACPVEFHQRRAARQRKMTAVPRRVNKEFGRMI